MIYNIETTFSTISELTELCTSNNIDDCSRFVCILDSYFIQQVNNSTANSAITHDNFNSFEECSSNLNTTTSQHKQCCGGYPFRVPTINIHFASWSCKQCNSVFSQIPENQFDCTRNTEGECLWYASEKSCLSCETPENPQESVELNELETEECEVQVAFARDCIPAVLYQDYPECESVVDEIFIENLNKSGLIQVVGPIPTSISKVWLTVSLEKYDFEEGIEFCESLGLSMGQVHSQEENEVLYYLPRERTRGFEIWIGSKFDGVFTNGDSQDARNWKWLDGQAICFDGWFRSDRWQEPNNSGANEACLEISWHGDDKGWNDWKCHEKCYVACEYRCVTK